MKPLFFENSEPWTQYQAFAFTCDEQIKWRANYHWIEHCRRCGGCLIKRKRTFSGAYTYELRHIRARARALFLIHCSADSIHTVFNVSHWEYRQCALIKFCVDTFFYHQQRFTVVLIITFVRRTTYVTFESDKTDAIKPKCLQAPMSSIRLLSIWYISSVHATSGIMKFISIEFNSPVFIYLLLIQMAKCNQNLFIEKPCVSKWRGRNCLC